MPSPVPVSALDELLALLETCEAAADRRAALELVAAMDGALSPWLARWAHLLARGGATTLLRLALAAPLATEQRRWAETVTAARPNDRPLLQLVGSTRGALAPAMTFETGLSSVGDVRFAEDDERIFAFAWGEPRGELAQRVGAVHGSWLLELSRRTGGVQRALRVGQFREENGAMGLSPDGRLAAVRDHRSTTIVELASGRAIAKLGGCEGPTALRFVDPRHLLVLDGSSLERWDALEGVRLQQVDACGFGDLAISPDGTEAVVTGSGRTAFARYALPSLELRETVALDRGRAPSVIAASPSGQVATGDWDHRVRRWAPGATIAEELGTHAQWVSAVRFADHGRALVSGGWDGQLMIWDVASGARRAVLSGHSGYLNALEIHRDQLHVLSCADDGDVRLWSLAEAQKGSPNGPPFSFAYGSHSSERAARTEGGRLLFRVGALSLAFTPEGVALGAVEGGWPGDPDVLFDHGRVVVSGDEDHPRVLRLLDANENLLEEAPTCAEPLVFAAVGDRLGVLEADGHVSFWRVDASR